MTRRGRVRALWPVVPAAIGVATLIATQPGIRQCPPSDYGWRRADPAGLCLPTLLPAMTGANPFAVGVSWLVVGAAIALLSWLIVRFVTRQGDI